VLLALGRRRWAMNAYMDAPRVARRNCVVL
jgi:hypothetical protein